MEITKGNIVYTVSETKTHWSVKTTVSKVDASYSVPKDICNTIDDLKKYILNNDMF